MKADFAVINAGQLITAAGYSERPKRGPELNELGIINDGAVAAKEGLIVAAGSTADVMKQVELTGDAMLIDAGGKVVLPGLVDPHTHLVLQGLAKMNLR